VIASSFGPDHVDKQYTTMFSVSFGTRRLFVRWIVCVSYIRACTYGETKAGEHWTYSRRSQNGLKSGSFSSDSSAYSAYEATQNPTNAHALMVLLTVLSSSIAIRDQYPSTHCRHGAACRPLHIVRTYVYKFIRIHNKLCYAHALVIVLHYRVRSDVKLILCKYHA